MGVCRSGYTCFYEYVGIYKKYSRRNQSGISGVPGEGPQGKSDEMRVFPSSSCQQTAWRGPRDCQGTGI